MKRTIALVSLIVMVSSFALFASGSSENSASATTLAYPKRVIEMVVPFGPGGSADLMARTVAQLMNQFVGKPVNVINKAGGGSTTGMMYVFEQPADGYTLLEITPSVPIIEALQKAPINFSEHFIPIGNFQVDIQSFAISKKNKKFSNLDEMLAYAKKNPGKVTIGGTSPGGLDDYMAQGFAEAAGIDLLYIPYNSAAETKSALLGGEIDIYQDKLISFLQMLQSDDVVPIVTLYDRRLAEVEEMKNVPCTVEMGINFTQGSWRGYAVKKGTPQEIVDYLEALLKRVYDSPEYKKKAEQDRSDIIPGYINAEAYGKLWTSELNGFRKIFKK